MQHLVPSIARIVKEFIRRNGTNTGDSWSVEAFAKHPDSNIDLLSLSVAEDIINNEALHEYDIPEAYEQAIASLKCGESIDSVITTLKRKLDVFVDTVELFKEMFATGGEVPPTCIMISETDKRMVSFHEFSPETKQLFFGTVLPIYAIKHGVHRYLFGVEAWMSNNPDCMPSEAEDRKECLIVLDVSDEDRRMAMFNIIRDGNGVRLEECNYQDVESHLMEALPPASVREKYHNDASVRRSVDEIYEQISHFFVGVSGEAYRPSEGSIFVHGGDTVN